MFEHQLRPILLILQIEAVILLGTLIVVIFKRIYQYFTETRLIQRINKAKEVILHAIREESDPDIEELEKISLTHMQLLRVIEDFDKNFALTQWDNTKKLIIDTLLRKKARKYTRSRFWKRKNFASRTFALSPTDDDIDQIYHLLTFQNFMVQSGAITASIKLGQAPLIHEMIRILPKCTKYMKHFIRDSIDTQNQDIYKIVLEATKNPELHPYCLDILSGKTLGLPMGFIEKDLNSANEDIQLLALKIFAFNPAPNILPKLLEFTHHSSSKLQTQAIRALRFYISKEIVFRLKEIFETSNDKKIQVEAGITLKALGETQYLQTQESHKNLADYVLQFG